MSGRLLLEAPAEARIEAAIVLAHGNSRVGE
jgi:hypothetical protein